MPLAGDVRHSPEEAPAKIDAATAKAYWRRTSALMWTMLAIWFTASFAVHLFAPSLNTIRVLGFPVGFYMAAQGSLIAFVVMLFLFASRQDTIDREEGVAEDN